MHVNAGRSGGVGREPLELLTAEARALLEAGADREVVENSRLVAFARACLELTEAGRLPLAVLDGGVFAPRRALELAALVATQAAAAPALAAGSREPRESSTGCDGGAPRAIISCMGAEARQILEKALGLSEHDRADLAAELMASLDGEPDADAEQAWAAEITLRAERAVRGETVGIRAEDVDAEARRTLEGK